MPVVVGGIIARLAAVLPAVLALTCLPPSLLGSLAPALVTLLLGPRDGG
jgi:hypothetical protein